jgi:DNA-binding CsgD family transcriptional regulator/tetratricopeptide (TPR) repeat protein
MTLRVGDPAASERLILDSIDLLERLQPGPELAKAYAAAAYGALMASRMDEASRRAAAAIELEAQTGPSAATVAALRVKATVESSRGDRVEAARTYERARRLAMAAGDLDMAAAVVIDTGLELLWTRQYGDARRLFEDAIELGRVVDLDVRVSYATSMLCQIHFEQGRWADAERIAATLLREQRRHPATHVDTLTTLGRVQVRRGDADAVATLTEALSITERGESDQLSVVVAGLAEAAWLSGRTREIPAVVGDIYERTRAEADLFPPSRWVAGELALWLWRAGALSEPPSGIAEPYALQIAGEWRLAAAAWDQIGCPYEQASALADGDEAAMHRALALFSRLGAEPAADRLRERMRQAGVSHLPARPRRSTQGAPAQLTRRQLEILELLERGLSNREIARRLFITEKTAGNHVSAILAKLEARSRTEAASMARRLGIGASET